MLKQGLPPIAGPATRIFILGSLPGDRSLREGRYYAHPTNQFWKLLGSVIGVELAALPYEERLKILGERGVGLWDVVGAALREGSADQAIREPVHNAIGGLKEDYPRLQAVAFNGGRAAKDGFRLLANVEGLELIALPSSSGLAAIPFAEKADRWQKLAQYCAG